MVAIAVGRDYYNIKRSSRLVHKFNSVHTCSRIIKWNAPHAPWLKINFDGSVVGSQVDVGFVARDHNGTPIVAGMHNLGENIIAIVETLVIRDALKFTIVKSFGIGICPLLLEMIFS